MARFQSSDGVGPPRFSWSRVSLVACLLEGIWMGESQPRFDRWSFRLLLVAVGMAAVSLLFLSDWYIPPIANTGFWNGFVAFTLLGISSRPSDFTGSCWLIRRIHSVSCLGAVICSTVAHGNRWHDWVGCPLRSKTQELGTSSV